MYVVRALVVLVALALTGCSNSSPTAPWRTGTVAAVASQGRILITNGTKQPVFTMAVGRQSLALINWAPCVDPVRCPPIEPGGTREVPYPGGGIGPEEREAVVYWWHARQDPGDGVSPDAIRTIIVDL